jgi:tRNA A-37 threonylcarbamoyl transferase component Bud32/TolB-like protein/tetratricopeptide (TPR) repeat protein
MLIGILLFRDSRSIAPPPGRDRMPEPSAGLKRALADRYTIQEEIGRGASATVYRAHDLRHDRTVAVKVLEPGVAASVGAHRFLREIRIAAGLSHPHVLPVYDSGAADGFVYYVMPYEAGQSLRVRLRRDGSIPVDDAVRILRDVADALAHAHRQGIVHRDIKPDNVLLSDRNAIVTDFGVAKALSESAGGSLSTSTGLAVGTPAYMSPEQATADPTADHRADIYAFGVLAYELLVGSPPFTGTDPAVIAGHLTQRPPDVSALRPAVPSALSSLIARCLAKEPADRYERAEELLEVLDGLPISGAPSPSAAPGPTGARRRTQLVRAAGLVALLAILGTWWMLRSRGGGADTRVAVAPFENRTGLDSLDALGAVAAEMVTNALTRAGVADIAPTQTVLAASLGSGGASPGMSARAIAEETRATLIVAGAYTLRGDSIAFQAQLVDATRNRVLAPIDPVTVPAAENLHGIQLLAEHTAVVLSARLHSPLSDVVAVADLPMSMDAYRAYVTGVEEFLGGGALPQAIRDLRLATKLDSTAAQPRIWLSLAVFASGAAIATADSILQGIDPGVRTLAPFDQAAYEWINAIYAGDQETALRAARRLRGMGWGIPDALSATRLNRLDEALDVIDAELHRPSSRESLYTWYWASQILHAIGDHERELKEARNAVQALGSTQSTLGYEIRALAALGQAAEARQLLVSVQATAPASGLFLSTAQELRTHGWTEAADSLGRDAIGWYRVDVAESPSSANRRLLAMALYRFGDAAEARTIFEALVSDSATDVVSLGYLGLDAARQADTLRADSVINRLDTMAAPHQHGATQLWQAEIAAELGECQRAVDFLRKGEAEGLAHPFEDPDLDRLQGCAVFDRYMEPKG